MNHSVQQISPLFIVGPPGAGKSTIGRVLASQNGAQFHTVDDWAGTVYPPSSRSMPMTDAQVEEAISLLFRRVGQSKGICEFAHHDYVGMLNDNRNVKFAVSRKIIVFADLETCLERNSIRGSPVAANYVERAWLSTKDLITLSTAQNGGNVLIIDTTDMPIPIAVAMAEGFFGKEDI